MFGKRSSAIYDLIYESRGRDYESQAKEIDAVVRRHKRGAGNALLDVACGTGGHLAHLQRWYEVEGLDISEEMLELAAKRAPGACFHRGDMAEFTLERRFDVLLCLFSSIGYVKSSDRLRKTIENLSGHLRPGGVVLIEPWYSPETYTPDTIHLAHVDRPDIKVARVNVSRKEGDLSVIYFHYLVAEKGSVEYFSERHEIGLFSHQEYLEAFRANHLELEVEDAGLTGRGLYIGRRALEEKG